MHGSQLDIISPVEAAKEFYGRVLLKSVQTIINNKTAKALGSGGAFSEYAQKVPTKTAISDGKIMYPQLNDSKLFVSWDNGKPTFYEIDQDLKKLLDNISTKESIDFVLKFCLLAKKAFVAGTTGSYPPFALVNVPRDTMTSAVVSQNGFIMGVSQADTLTKLMAGNKEYKKWSEEYHKIARERHTRSRMDDTLDTETMLARIQGVSKKAFGGAGNVAAETLNVLSLPSELSEELTRVSEYILARKNGKSVVQALEDAGNVSGSFHKIGNWWGGNNWIRTIPYFNATVQVLNQLSRAFGNADKANNKSMNRSIKWLLMAGATIGYAVYQNYENQKKANEDEGLRANLDSLPIQMAAMYQYILKNDGNFVRIPMEQMFGMLANLVVMAINEYNGDAKYGLKDYAQNLTSILPEGMNIIEPKGAFLSVIPQGFQPSLQLAFNKKVFPEVSDIVPFTLQGKEAIYQYTDRTSSFAKALGAKTDMSPIKIDFFLEQSAGRTVKLATHADKLFSDPNEYLEMFNPFTQRGNFWYGRNMQAYFDAQKEIKALMDTYKNERRDMPPAEYEQFEAKLEIVKALDKITAAKRNIDKEIRLQIEELEKKKTPRKELNRIKKELMENNPDEKELRIEAYRLLKELEKID